MARTTIQVSAPPEAVFAVLSDPFTYAQWVVGCKEIRRVDGDWPEPGATFHHSVGLGPITVRDTTSVEACEPGRRLVLRAGEPQPEAMRFYAAAGFTRIPVFGKWVEDPTSICLAKPVGG